MSSSSMLRQVVDKTEAMDTALKWSLLDRVNDCVKELQLKCTSERSNALNNDEATNSFLWVLEGIFIHGLTNSFLKSVTPFSSLMSSSFFSSSRRLGVSETASSPVPNPSFWEYVLVFLHRDIIDQINSLHLIHTDVGRCRAWLRIALNEGLLLSFLENMTLKSNKRCLKAFYRTSAFLRDVEKCDILKNYLMGIELLDFRLVINNSFLNHWNSGPLSLVGLWVDENEMVQQGIDIAQNMESKEIQAIPRIQQRNSTPPRFYSELDSVLRRPIPPPLLSEEDALRIILSSSPRVVTQPPTVKPPQPSSYSLTNVNQKRLPSVTPSKSRPSKVEQMTTQNLVAVEQPKDSIVSEKSGGDLRLVTPSLTVIVETASPTKKPEELAPAPAVEENVAIQKGEQSHSIEINGQQEIVEEGITQELVAECMQSTVSLEIESPLNDQSYTDMLLKYKQRSQKEQDCVHNESYSNSSTTSNTSNVLEESHNSTGSSFTTTSASGSRMGSHSKPKTRRTSLHSQLQTKFEAQDGLELIKSPYNTKENIMELLPRISKYTKIIANEAGLDNQNYACKICGTSIGMIYGPARLCHFTGFSYCTACHLNQQNVIPSRILLNWDFGLYAVCNQAHDFLDELKDQPIFDVQEINSSLYTEIDECAQVKALRTKLFYIGMYLKTCKNTKAFEELTREAHPQEHLLDSIHMYTLSDLLGIPNRSLVTLLTKLVSTGSGHILSCTICREKGFICEICRKPQVIFPFELEKIFKCAACGAVYHNTCMENGKRCPRCERWQKKDSIEDDEMENEHQHSETQ